MFSIPFSISSAVLGLLKLPTRLLIVFMISLMDCKSVIICLIASGVKKSLKVSISIPVLAFTDQSLKSMLPDSFSSPARSSSASSTPWRILRFSGRWLYSTTLLRYLSSITTTSIPGGEPTTVETTPKALQFADEKIIKDQTFTKGIVENQCQIFAIRGLKTKERLKPNPTQKPVRSFA